MKLTRGTAETLYGSLKQPSAIRTTPTTGRGVLSKARALVGAATVMVMGALPTVGCGDDHDDGHRRNECCYSGNPCGGCEEPAPVVVEESPCGETQCCVKPAPKLEDVGAAQRITGDVWKIGVTVPEFDTVCQGPLRLRILAMLYSNPGDGVYYGEGEQESALREDYLQPDTTEVNESGRYDVYGYQPPYAAGVASLRVCVETSQGVETCGEQQPGAM